MNDDKIIKNILDRYVAEATAARKGAEVEVDETTTITPQGTDYYQASRDVFRTAKRVQAYGTSPRFQVDLEQVTNQFLLPQYKKAKEDSDSLKKRGDKRHAQMVMDQYMQDSFLPMIESLVQRNSAPGMLADKDALDTLDSFTLLEGTNGKGYTASFISTLYEPNQATEISDDQVRRLVFRLNELCEAGEIRAAAAEAKRMKDKIDTGKNLATPEDYEVIEKVVLSTI